MKVVKGLFFSLLLIYLTIAGEIIGKVIDARTKKPIEKARCSLLKVEKTVFSNKEGTFIFKELSPGEYYLKIEAVGYQSKESSVLKLKRGEKIELTIELIPEIIILEEVEVKLPAEPLPKEPSVSKVTTGELKKLPSFGGDVLRSLEALPGVMTAVEFGNALCVRGGNPTENLFLVDGMEVSYPFHWEGIASVFNSDTIDNISLYAGGFPARFGDKLSSVLDITLKKPVSKKLKGDISLGLLSSKVYLEGSLFNKGNFFLSAHRTYYDLLYQLARVFIGQDKIPSLWFGFGDCQGKWSFEPTPKDKLDFEFFFADDFVKARYEERAWGRGMKAEIKYKKGFYLTGVRWRRSLSPKFLSEAILYFRNYHEQIGAQGKIEYWANNEKIKTTDFNSKLKSYLNTYVLKEILSLTLNEQHTLNFGGELEVLRGKEETMIAALENVLGGTPANTQINPYKTLNISLFLEDEWQIISPLVFTPSIRLDYYSALREVCFSPRLNINYKFTPQLTLRALFGVHFQPTLTLEERISHLLVGDFFDLESLERLTSSRAYHFVLGGEKRLGDWANLRVEVYYKRLLDLISGPPLTFQEMLNKMLTSGTPEETTSPHYSNDGSGYAYGLELLLRKRLTPKSFGWISYTLSKTRHRQKLGEYYDAPYDRPHMLTLAYGTALGKWYLSLKFRASSGAPYTPAAPGYEYYYENLHLFFGETPGSLVIQGRELPPPPPAKRNLKRLPFYHRLDLRIERTWGKKQNKTWFLDIMNVYNHRNVIGIAGEEEIKGLTIIPTFGLSVRF
jgi:hypothetical protein